MTRSRPRLHRCASVLAALAYLMSTRVSAHHSLAMYDLKMTYMLTGVVVRVDPNPNHLQIFIAPLNEARNEVIRDSRKEPIVWAIEFEAASVAARDGITVNNFPRGTVVSVGLHPLRSGQPAGARGKYGLFRCPPDTGPAAGKHCDTVKGSIGHGRGVLPVTAPPVPKTMP